MKRLTEPTLIRRTRFVPEFYGCELTIVLDVTTFWREICCENGGYRFLGNIGTYLAKPYGVTPQNALI
jgi:hypothetical protein